jgi:hypothetical protein
MTENFLPMAHSSDDDDDGDYSQRSEDEDEDYADYVEIATTGQQSFFIPRHAPDGGDTQGHEHGTSKTQTGTRRAS